MVHAQLSGQFGTGQGQGLLGSIKRVFALMAAFAVGALVLMAAGVVAVATAIVGLLIAFVAMLLRFGAYRGVRGRMSKAKKAAERQAAQSEPVLEARRTARGWTVDG